MKLSINYTIIITSMIYIMTLPIVTQNQYIINIFAILMPFIYVSCKIGFNNMIDYIIQAPYIDNFKMKYSITIFLYVSLLLIIMFSDVIRAISELLMIFFVLCFFLKN